MVTAFETWKGHRFKSCTAHFARRLIMLERQIEDILKRKGVTPRPLTNEEIMQRVAERMEKVLPSVMEKIVDSIIDEELATLGRSQTCRYWHKTKGCSKGLDACRVDCDGYQPCRWWQQRPGVKATYAAEGLLIGMCVFAGISAFLSPELLLPVVCLWLVLVIISRLHIMYLHKFLRRFGIGR